MFTRLGTALQGLSWQKPLQVLKNHNFILFLWLLIATITSIKQYFLNSYNNFNIYKFTFYHALEGLNLSKAYPAEHLDTNHYGPLFSLLIVPFALLPDFLGQVTWQLSNVLFLYYAVKQLPLDDRKISFIYWIILNELITAMLSFQFNISITAIIILSYALIEKRKNFWAAFFILFGTFIKLYGIVGLAFFFFVKDKPKFVLYCIVWGGILFLLPMIFFTPQYILQSYFDWYSSLMEKQSLNASLTSMQDISLMGIVRRISGIAAIPNLPFLVCGILVFALPYLRIKEYGSSLFRLHYLASVLIFTVIFSNSSESPTYIIAFAGVAIWFVLQSASIKPVFIFLFILALVLTSLSPTDIFPRFIRNEYIRPYSLKAFPCVLIWFVISYQLMTQKFSLKIGSV
ncbi:glycosyltransferase family 87 protein [Daejeonella sp.]|uniref:glycosyltransferase family 87 protein n=1 Tax=Daejeonella sp. TaxID=2805397 RepID=UPI00272F7002|nr:glycosyltransferase family 87 protein [Daejeonella sp.]MDP2414255.1 glycosyltransferase family 87 protein [Daejeonella sp.]